MPEAAPLRASIGDSCLRILINDLRMRGKRLSIVMNGVELQRVVEYDTAQGFAVIHRLKDGHPFIENGQVARLRVYKGRSAH